MISLNVSQHSPALLDAVSKGGSTAASSPFVVICQQTGVKVLPSVINAVVRNHWFSFLGITYAENEFRS